MGGRRRAAPTPGGRVQSMRELEPLERRVFACAWAPDAHEPSAHTPPAHEASAFLSPAVEGVAPPELLSADVSVAGEEHAYNTPWLTDAQLLHWDSMSAAEIR